MADFLSISSEGRSSVNIAQEEKSNSFAKSLEKNGRLPPVSLMVKPLDTNREQFFLDRFLTYEFQSSILIPVDTFQFTFVAPDDLRPIPYVMQEGDIIQLRADDSPLATGIIDSIPVGTTEQDGEVVEIFGRDLMGQLEDNNAVNLDSTPMWGENIAIDEVIRRLAANTRINPDVTIQGPDLKPGPFATEPNETKLQTLQRYLEPLNALAWMNSLGRIVVGKPDMKQGVSGKIFNIKSQRSSNTLDIKVIRQTTKIANIIVPIWAGQENVQNRIGIEQALLNARENPTRLRKLGHRVIKTVVVSAPNGDGSQGLDDVRRLEAAGQNVLQAYAKRDLARANVNEMIVQAMMPGHFNEFGQPYRFDTTYKIEYEKGAVDEVMYLYECKYMMDERQGPRTLLSFCPLGSIVADVEAP